MTFPDRLKQLMESRTITVDELAAKVGVSNVTIRHWRNGRWEPKVRAAMKLARFFHVTVEELFNEN